jgi:hypothetical protein
MSQLYPSFVLEGYMALALSKIMNPPETNVYSIIIIILVVPPKAIKIKLLQSKLAPNF